MKQSRRWTRLLTFVGACALSLALTAPAQAKDIRSSSFGIGLGSGTVTNGLSGKFFMGKNALQVTLGGNDFKFGALHVGADYLWEMPALANGSVVEVAWNAGLGAGVVIGGDDLFVAVSGVLGLEFNFKPLPIDLVLEYRPSLSVIPKVGFGYDGFTGHIRWYF